MAKKILFIEDDRLIVKIYTTRLKYEGFEVLWAQDGEDGLTKFNQENPDLVVLDLMIPKISGPEILQKIRSQNKTVPIIIYSVLSDRDRINKLKAAGANEYFVKPDTHPKQLVERIKSYFV